MEKSAVVSQGHLSPAAYKTNDQQLQQGPPLYYTGTIYVPEQTFAYLCTFPPTWRDHTIEVHALVHVQSSLLWPTLTWQNNIIFQPPGIVN
jgi:hypothetical protein